MRKSTILAGLFGVMAFLGVAWAASTTYTNLTITDNTTLGNAVGDTITLNGVTLLQSNAAPRTNVTPTRSGAVIWDSVSGVVCVSTGTTRFTWALLTSTSTVCPH